MIRHWTEYEQQMKYKAPITWFYAGTYYYFPEFTEFISHDRKTRIKYQWIKTSDDMDFGKYDVGVHEDGYDVVFKV